MVAQEIEKIDPSFVSYGSGFLPGIYRHGKVVSYASGVLELELYNLVPDAEAASGDEVRLIATNLDLEGDREVKVEAKLLSKKVLSGNTILIPMAFRDKLAWEGLKRVFVFGKKVDDVRTVNYNKIYNLNVSVTQELIKENEAFKNSAAKNKEEMIHLEEDMKEHEAFKSDVTKRMKDVEQAIKELVKP